MTAGAPLGSFIAARLFHAAFAPQVILQIAAALLAVSALLYVWINRREERRAPAPRAMESAAGGFRLVLGNRYLLLIAGLIVLLNLVNTTGEYLVARLLTLRVGELAAAHPGFNKQAYIGAFSGDYQFWVNVTAFALQAVVASRLVKYAGLAGALLALPLIAFGGYAVMSAGVSFSVVRWIKTAENATDYSIMNTARQMLWLPTSRDEKYKAKQAIDTFFVRGGDVLSAMAVYLGASVLHLGVQQFAIVNTVLAVVWIGLALTIVRPAVAVRAAGAAAPTDWRRRGHRRCSWRSRRPPRRSRPAKRSWRRTRPTRPRTSTPTSRPSWSSACRPSSSCRAVSSAPAVYPFIGSTMDGGGFAAGPAVRARFGDTGALDAHAAWSVKNYRAANANLSLPLVFDSRVRVQVGADWIDAPDVAFYGVGNASTENRRSATRIGPRPSASRRRSGRRRPSPSAAASTRCRPRARLPARRSRSRPRAPPTGGRAPSPNSTGARPAATPAAAASIASTGATTARPARGPPASIAPTRTSASSSRCSARTGSSRSARSHRRRRPRRVRTCRSSCCRISAAATRCAAISPGVSATATGCC